MEALPDEQANEPDMDESMRDWILAYEGFDTAGEGLRESLCTLGNGYFCTRGAAPETVADDIHYPGTYMAGGYNRLKTEIAEHVVENEDLVNLPNWLLTRFRIEGGNWFNLMSVVIYSYRQELNLREGVLSRSIHFRDREGRETVFAMQRLVHMEQMHLAAQALLITPVNWTGRLELHSALDGTVINAGVERYRQLGGKHLEPLEAGTFSDDGIWLLTQTNQSHLRVALAARTRVYENGVEAGSERRLVREPGYVAQEMSCEAAPDRPLRVEKTVALCTSRDFAISEPAGTAVEALKYAGDFVQLKGSHVVKWRHLWDRCDIKVADSQRTQMILRLHIFHLLQTASRNSIDLDTGVPARGWHGEAYRGHIFWDELFIFPFLNLRVPALTRALLLYRYRRLDQARLAARREGLKGALYPWQSGSSGREETQQLHFNPRSGRWLPDNSHLQRHVNAAIAYNVWQHYQATGDLEFMATNGTEMILEIARFLAGITSYDAALDRYEIRGVMGPDEYHDRYPDADEPGLNNNSYTNVMTVWVMRTAIRALGLLAPKRRGDLKETIGLTKDETDQWQDIIHKMRVVFHDGGIISQFEGYDQLEELDWDGYRRKYGDIQRLDRILEAEGDTTNRYKASKQADAVMLFYLFTPEELGELFRMMGYLFDPGLISANIEYYLKRSSNGSTLSNIVHSWVLARSDRAGSWDLFNQALESDVEDIQGGTTHEGIHLGAMAGTVDILQRCYTGIGFSEDMITFDPLLPVNLERLSMMIKYRGNWFDIDITQERMAISSRELEDGAIRIGFRGAVHDIKRGGRLELPMQQGT